VGNVINFATAVPTDPILRKGDLVRLLDMEMFADLAEDISDEDDGFLRSLESVQGVVLSICMLLPDDHPDAPNQAMYIDVALPFEDGWEVVEGISIHHIHRILGEDAMSLRGYDHTLEKE